MQRLYKPDVIFAELISNNQVISSLKISDISVGDKLEKYLEDVR